MDNRNSLDGLQLIRGVSSSGTTGQQTKSSRAGGQSTPIGVQAPCAGGRIVLAALDSGVRMDKVSAVRSALSEGKYNVPASEVASRVMDSMFGKRR